jgi:predicted nucleic acid-binding protein
LTHRSTYLRALDLFVRHRVDFEDALTVAHMERQGISELYSYETVTRHEPAHDVRTG